MMNTPNHSSIKNMGESVRQRLLDGARKRGEEFNLVLTRYAIERLLYRLGLSKHRERFILKGAALYVVWAGQTEHLSYRPTRDLDLWGSGSPDAEGVAMLLREIVEQPVEEDGLVFLSETIRSQPARQEELYEGCRLSLVCLLHGARIPLVIDVGFGDAITPPAEETDYPVLLPSLPAPRLRVYPRETVIAEKFEALVSLDLTNTRLKDFYDLWMLSQGFEFEGRALQTAIVNTFTRRQTALPPELPNVLTPRFAADSNRIAAWNQFIKRNRISDAPTYETVMTQIEHFLWPIIEATKNETVFELKWSNIDGWK
jgi:predicted nucleotidyltransferase component of viral defense system